MRVGRALDSLRDALVSYVDDAMTAAHGARWDDVVAEDNARARGSRKYPVAKGDLVVLLKAIQHRRISPWSDLPNYPRIRGLAAEVVVVRNLYAHGDDCADEFARLVDTSQRLLGGLGLRTPSELAQIPTPAPAALGVQPKTLPAVAAPASSNSEDAERHARELDALTRLQPIMEERLELTEAELEVFNESGGDPARSLRVTRELLVPIGQRYVGLLAKLERALDEHIAAASDLALLKVGVAALSTLNNSLASVALHMYEVDLAADRDPTLRMALNDADLKPEEWDPETVQALAEALAEVRRSTRPGPSVAERCRDLVRYASRFPDSDLDAGQVIVFALTLLASEAPATQKGQEEALSIVREASTRARFLAALEPGSSWEQTLAGLLLWEGKACNELGLADEAVRALARADEIIDRYPAADPRMSSTRVSPPET